MNAAAQSHDWSPIEGLPDSGKVLSDPETTAVIRAWLDQAGELRKQDAYREFLGRLRRQWAIETGVLERLYDLDEGVTKTLIEKGLDAAIITHEHTDEPPEYVLGLIRDQHQTIEGLYQFISGNRPLGTSYVKELHQAITRRQATYDATDAEGRRYKEPFTQDLKGVWKKWSNNVEGAAGYRFEFCPPEQVSGEMDRLVAMHAQHEAEGIPADVQAAWLHHRFVLIHPFVDGNGRVARCLATLVLLKANWLPLVITRHDKPDYLTALRQADSADLKSLISYFGSLQRRSVVQALSLSEEVVKDLTPIRAILGAVKEKRNKRYEDIAALKRKALTIADSLQKIATERLTKLASEIDVTLGNQDFDTKIFDAPRGTPTALWNSYQIRECARALGYYANLDTHRSWAGIQIIVDDLKTELVFSFHAVGQTYTGVLACAAMAYQKVPIEMGSVVNDLSPLSREPFTFSYANVPQEVERTFRSWLEDRIILGLDYWRKSI